MVLVSLVYPRLLPVNPDSLFWGTKCRYRCDNIVVNPLLDLEFSFVIDPMENVELSVRDVIDILWWPPSYFPCITNNRNTEFPSSNQHPEGGKNFIHPHHILLCITICG